MTGRCLDPACDCYAEIERLKALLSCAADALTYETQKVRVQGQLERKEAQAGIERLKFLLARAADALEVRGTVLDQSLIDELRKAAK